MCDLMGVIHVTHVLDKSRGSRVLYLSNLLHK